MGHSVAKGALYRPERGSPAALIEVPYSIWKYVTQNFPSRIDIVYQYYASDEKTLELVNLTAHIIDMRNFLFSLFWISVGLLISAAAVGWPFFWPTWNAILYWRPTWSAAVPLGIVTSLLVTGAIRHYVELEALRKSNSRNKQEDSDNGEHSDTRVKPDFSSVLWIILEHLSEIFRVVWPSTLQEWGQSFSLLVFAGASFMLLPPVFEDPYKWQQAIGAIIGFFGLAAAALFNAWLTRRRDEQIDRKHADAIRNVFIAELSNIERTDWRARQTVSKMIEEQFDVFSSYTDFKNAMSTWLYETNTNIYETHQDRLDHLSGFECRMVVDTYKNIQEARSSLKYHLDNTLDEKNQSGKRQVSREVKYVSEIMFKYKIREDAHETRRKLEFFSSSVKSVELQDLQYLLKYGKRFR